MAETKAQQLARLLREIETTEGSMWFDTALLGLETLPIGVFGRGAVTSKSALSATKAAKPTQAQKAALAVKGQQNLTQEIIDLAPPDPAELERLQSLYRYTPEERLIDVAGNELLHYEKMFRGASDELIDYARQYNKEYLVSKIPKMEAEMYAPFQKGYLEYAMNLPEGSLPVDLKTFANREIDRLNKLILDQRFQELLENPNALSADDYSPYALAEADIPFTPKKRAPEPGSWPSKPWHMETQINQSRSRQLEPSKVASQGEINLAKKQAMIKDSLRRLERQRSLLDEIKSDPDKFIGEDGYMNEGRLALDFDLFDAAEHKKMQTNFLSDPKARDLFMKRNDAMEMLRQAGSTSDELQYRWRDEESYMRDQGFFIDIEEKLLAEAWMDIKKELQRKGYPEELIDSIKGMDYAKKLSFYRQNAAHNEVSEGFAWFLQDNDFSSGQDFVDKWFRHEELFAHHDTEVWDLPRWMKDNIPSGDDFVAEAMAKMSKSDIDKLKSKSLEVHAPDIVPGVKTPLTETDRTGVTWGRSGVRDAYPEPEQIMDAITARDFARPYSQIDRTYDASLNAALSNYAEARAKFAFSFVPVIPTGMSLYEGYQTRSGLMEKAEEMKVGMTPEEIREAERLASPPPREVDLPGSVTEGMDTVIDMVKGYMGEFGGYDSPDRIPEYDEDDDILYKSFDRDRR